jgi:hypothetical protein
MPIQALKMPAKAGKQAKAKVAADQNTLRVGDLAPGTLFRITSSAKNRLFVRAGNGLGPNGFPLMDRIGCPPIYAVVVPETKGDRRAWTPATERLNQDTRVASTHGILSVGF